MALPDAPNFSQVEREAGVATSDATRRLWHALADIYQQLGAGRARTSFSGSFTGTFTGSLTGNASTATALQTPRTINGVSFDGTANITVAAAAGTLTGATLAANVTASSLTSVGTLTSLSVSGNGSFGGTLSASNLSGTNTGDQTLPTRASLGLDTGDTPTFAGVNLTASLTVWSGPGYLVADGGGSVGFNASFASGAQSIGVFDGANNFNLDFFDGLFVGTS